jgi:hypothetical protein
MDIQSDIKEWIVHLGIPNVLGEVLVHTYAYSEHAALAYALTVYGNGYVIRTEEIV